MKDFPSELKSRFDTVVALVQSSPSGEYVPDETKLRLYGLYKRCSAGRSASSDEPDPAIWNFVAYRKRNAWKKCDELELDEAMEEYIRVVSMLDNATGTK